MKSPWFLSQKVIGTVVSVEISPGALTLKFLTARTCSTGVVLVHPDRNNIKIRIHEITTNSLILSIFILFLKQISFCNNLT